MDEWLERDFMLCGKRKLMSFAAWCWMRVVGWMGIVSCRGDGEKIRSLL